VSFRHPDPAIAAKFLNELANALIATQGDLVNWSRLSEQNFRVDKWSLCRG
jgi:hypothetical protein